jgi:hypothetical protein
MKRCARCHEQKLEEEFYANGRWRDGRHPYCKSCLLSYQRERRRLKLDRANPDRRRWSASFVRHDYFRVIEAPLHAYLAGLLAADGNVLEQQRRVTLELSTRDEELVLLARDEIAPGFPVRRRVRRNGTKTTLLAVTSARLCTDLAELHITPRKSLTLRWPSHLGCRALRFFLLGYFDGDGFVTRSRNGRYTYERWALLGTEEFLTEAMNFISHQTGVRSRRVRRHGSTNIHTAHIGGADAIVVDRWLHNGTNLGLIRKRLATDARQADSAASSSSFR